MNKQVLADGLFHIRGFLSAQAKELGTPNALDALQRMILDALRLRKLYEVASPKRFSTRFVLNGANVFFDATRRRSLQKSSFAKALPVLVDSMLPPGENLHFRLDHVGFYSAMPGAPLQSSHRDFANCSAEHPRKVVLFIAPQTLTEENGTTGFLLRDDDNDAKWVYPELQAGDAILMRGDIVHRGGHNKSHETRNLVFCVFDSTPSFTILDDLGCYTLKK